MFKHKISVGLECFIDYPQCDDDHDRNEITTAIPIEKAGVIRPGFAIDQARLCTDFVTNKEDLIEKLSLLRDGLEGRSFGVVNLYPGRKEGKAVLQPAVWDDPSYRAIMMPLYHPSEGGERSRDLHALADTCTCVIDIDVTHLNQEQRLLRWNLLNAVAPLVLVQAHKSYLPVKLARHKVWQYCASKERLPTGWWWQRDFASYKRNVASLASVFAQDAARASAKDVFGSGIFHWAQLLKFEQKHVLRYWILPTMNFAPLVSNLGLIDSWLARAASAMAGIRVRTLLEALPYLPLYKKQALPADPSTRMYLWESR